MVFHCRHGFFAHVVFIDEFGGFFIQQQFHRRIHAQFLLFGFALSHIGKHALQLLGEIFHAWRAHNRHGRRALGDFDFDFFVVQAAIAQHFAEFLTRVAFRLGVLGFALKTHLAWRWQQSV